MWGGGGVTGDTVSLKYLRLFFLCSSNIIGGSTYTKSIYNGRKATRTYWKITILLFEYEVKRLKKDKKRYNEFDFGKM